MSLIVIIRFAAILIYCRIAVLTRSVDDAGQTGVSIPSSGTFRVQSSHTHSISSLRMFSSFQSASYSQPVPVVVSSFMINTGEPSFSPTLEPSLSTPFSSHFVSQYSVVQSSMYSFMPPQSSLSFMYSSMLQHSSLSFMYSSMPQHSSLSSMYSSMPQQSSLSFMFSSMPQHSSLSFMYSSMPQQSSLSFMFSSMPQYNSLSFMYSSIPQHSSLSFMFSSMPQQSSLSFMLSSMPHQRPLSCPSVRPTTVFSTAPTIDYSVVLSFGFTLSMTTQSSQSTADPSIAPSLSPSSILSDSPSLSPSSIPSIAPSLSPSSIPSIAPSLSPSSIPSDSPSLSPSSIPTILPSTIPSQWPSASLSTLATPMPTTSVPSTTQPISSLPTTTALQPSTMVSIAPSYSPSIRARVQYPQILSPLNISATRNAMQILVNVSRAGDVFCAAVKPGATIASVQDIRNSINAGSAVVDSPGSTAVGIDGLSPFTAYAVYCYTDDFIYHVMPLRDALLTKSLVSTLCCKQILIMETHPSIVQYVEGRTYADPLFRFALDSTPSGAVTIQLGVSRSTSCSTADSDTVSGPNPTISPQLFHFDSSSLSLAGTFAVRGREPGCFQVELRSTHSEDYYTPVNVSVIIRSISTPPDPPQMSIISFTGDGTALFVSFDSESNLGVQLISYTDRPFQCSLLISFTDIGNSTRCTWFSGNQLMVDIIASGVQPNVGDWVTLRKGVLTAACLDSDCSHYNSNDEQALSISPPSKAVAPMVSLVSPSSVAFCDDLVIDPTASTGFCGRDWKSVQWSVTQNGIAQNADLIAAHLNTHYSSMGSSQPVLIPNRLLTRSTDSQLSSYSIYLQLTNFLGKTAKQGVVVAIDKSSTVQPTVYLVNSDPLSYRWKMTSVFASASYAACLDTSDASFAYSWAVYKGATYMPALTSTSRQPRYFTLNPYSLDASASYSVTVTVTATTATAAVTVTSSALIQVGSSGVMASLRGGSMSTVSSSSSVSLDASPSMDIDYPSSNAGLTFAWQCIETQPVYGGACSFPFAKYSGEMVALPEGSLDPNVYVITVTVSNAAGATDSASMRVTVVESILPILQMDKVAAKYNVDSKLVLSGTVTSSLNRAVGAEWTCTSISSFSSNGMALTPLTISVDPLSSQVFQLAIAANSLLPGLQYSFQLAATYATSTIAAMAVVVVTMNSPPRGGSLAVSPTTGFALVTVYSLSAVKWIDDSSDLPLRYEFAYYLLNAAELNFVKTADVTSYVSTILGQGLYSMNYEVSCVAIVSDIYDSSSSATVSIGVSPPTSRRQLGSSGSLSASTMDSIERSMQRDLAAFNPSSAVRMVDATLSTVNAVDCSNITVHCTELNRQLCSTTANTCGGCLSGYIGLSGDSNTPCGLSSSLRRINEACSDARMCITGSCADGRCADGLKTCPSDCSGNGRCHYYDENGRDVEECRVSDSNCRAHCLCNEGYYGVACNVGPSSYVDEVSLREFLCKSIYEASFMQDPTATAIQSRSLTVSNILSDISLISEAAFTNCTSALVSIIIENPSLSCSSSSSFGLTLAAFSNLLNILSTPHHATIFEFSASSVVSHVSQAIEQLMIGCQGGLALGEAPIGVVNPNLRVLTSKVSQSSLDKTIFRIPMSSFESFSGSMTSNVTLDKSYISPSQSMGLTMYQFSRNTGAAITNSSRLVVQTNVYGSVSSSPTASKLTVSLQNMEPIQYVSIDPSNVTVSCEAKSQPYAVEERCPDGSTINVTCPGDHRAEYLVSCPGRITAPKCQVTAEDGQSDWNCTVKEYDAVQTTCECTVKNSRARRHLADTVQSSRTAEFSSASTSSSSTGYYSEKYSPAPSFQPTTVHKRSSGGSSSNTTVVIICSVVGAFFAVLVLLLASWYIYIRNSCGVQDHYGAMLRFCGFGRSLRVVENALRSEESLIEYPPLPMYESQLLLEGSNGEKMDEGRGPESVSLAGCEDRFDSSEGAEVEGKGVDSTVPGYSLLQS